MRKQIILTGSVALLAIIGAVRVAVSVAQGACTIMVHALTHWGGWAPAEAAQAAPTIVFGRRACDVPVWTAQRQPAVQPPELRQGRLHRLPGAEPAGRLMRWYTVYDGKTEEVLASGTGPQCAKALHLTIDSFYCAVYRTLAGTQHKYDFYIENIKRSELQ